MEDNLDKYKTYANDVLAGKIVTGKYIKLACLRYLSWFDRSDLYFDTAKCDQCINFISHLKHYAGKSANKPFILEEWLKWILYNIYGWRYKSTGLRVTNKVFIMIGRKNGKSAFASAIALYELMCGLQGGLIYNIATSREQAKLLFDMEIRFGKSIDPKEKYLKFQRDRIFFNKKWSYTRCLASDTTKLDGLGASLVLFDETHAYKGSLIYDVMISSQGFVLEPLAILITTAGFNLYDFCYNYREMCTEILQGVKQDDTIFSAIYELDELDKWDDESVWCKANPNLDITITRKYIRDQVQMAKNNTSLLVGVMTKNLNKWVSSSDVWLSNDEILDISKELTIADFVGKQCTIGIDLSATSDLTAVCLCALNEDGKYLFKPFYYLPSSCLEDNVNSELYKVWKRNKYITMTPGNVTDYDYILQDILRWQSNGVIINKIGYDSWNSTLFVISCTEQGLPMEPYSQSLGNFNKPTKEWERQVKMKNIILDNNIINRWCIANCALKYDWNDNCKPIKGGSPNLKIDGVIAILEAFGLYILTPKYNNMI